MRRDPLKLWDTSWCSEDVNNNRATITQMKSEALNNKDKQTNKQTNKTKSPGSEFQKNLGGLVQPAFQNLYPIYDQNLRYLLPYL